MDVSAPQRRPSRSSPKAREARRARGPATDKRAAILTAALELFSERTYNGTPMPMLAERAGVAAGTIYRYFPSKESLVNALYRHWKEELFGALEQSVPPGLTPREEFARLWGALWAFATENPEAFAFLETHHHSAYLDPSSRRAAARVTVVAVDFVRRAQAADAIRRAPPALLIAMVYGALVGLVKAAQDGEVRLDRTAMAASEETAWAMLGATRRAETPRAARSSKKGR